MIKSASLVSALILSLASSLAAQLHDYASVHRPQLSAALLFGYYSGMSAEARGVLSNIAEGFPLKVRFGVSYTTMEPGDAWDARRIFINNATNGTPEERGRTWAVKLDMAYAVSLLSLSRSHLYGGLRYARFTGNFRFVGGNEDFDIRNSQWGLGGGCESYFAVSRRLDMILTAGIDYYFSGPLSGHDTAYSPTGDNVNPRQDYTYADADAAIGQPKLTPLLMLGVSYNF
jgi:hypothetical protein